MKKKDKQSNEIHDYENLLRSFCEYEVKVCGELNMNLLEVNIGIELGVAYVHDQIQKLKLEKLCSSEDKKSIYDNFAFISKKLAMIARDMVHLNTENRIQEVGLQIVQHNCLSPLIAMMVTSKIVNEPSRFVH